MGGGCRTARGAAWRENGGAAIPLFVKSLARMVGRNRWGEDVRTGGRAKRREAGGAARLGLRGRDDSLQLENLLLPLERRLLVPLLRPKTRARVCVSRQRKARHKGNVGAGGAGRGRRGVRRRARGGPGRAGVAPCSSCAVPPCPPAAPRHAPAAPAAPRAPRLGAREAVGVCFWRRGYSRRFDKKEKLYRLIKKFNKEV